MSTETIINNLLNLFAIFGSTGSVHSDRGIQFESANLKISYLRMELLKQELRPITHKAMENAKNWMKQFLKE